MQELANFGYITTFTTDYDSCDKLSYIKLSVKLNASQW